MSVFKLKSRTIGLKSMISNKLLYVRTHEVVYKKWASIVLLSCLELFTVPDSFDNKMRGIVH